MATLSARVAADITRNDLLRFAAVRNVITSPLFPYVFQVLTLVALIVLAALGWGLLTPRGVPDKLYAKANLVNLAVWGLFWPAVIWVTVLLGRVWCTVCPLELISNAAERAGRALRLRQYAVPAWMRAGWLMVIGYALLQLLVSGVHLHRVPMYTSLFLLGTLVLATITGLLLRDRAFCRAFCAVAPLLKIYGRGGMLAVRSRSAACSGCSDKACVDSRRRCLPDARSCPSLLNPETLSNSEDCLLCTQCVKTCRPESIQFLVRAPYDRSDQRTLVASWPATAFIMLLSGFVTSEVASEWASAKGVFAAPADWIHTAGISGLEPGWIEGIWTVFRVPPAALELARGGWLLCSGARRTFSMRGGD